MKHSNEALMFVIYEVCKKKKKKRKRKKRKKKVIPMKDSFVFNVCRANLSMAFPRLKMNSGDPLITVSTLFCLSLSLSALSVSPSLSLVDRTEGSGMVW